VSCLKEKLVKMPEREVSENERSIAFLSFLSKQEFAKVASKLKKGGAG
jgi:hypothetical protein